MAPRGMGINIGANWFTSFHSLASECLTSQRNVPTNQTDGSSSRSHGQRDHHPPRTDPQGPYASFGTRMRARDSLCDTRSEFYGFSSSTPLHFDPRRPWQRTASRPPYVSPQMPARGPCGVDVSVYAGCPTFGGGGSPTFGGMKVSTFGGGVGRGWVNIVVALVEEEVRWRELRI